MRDVVQRFIDSNMIFGRIVDGILQAGDLRGGELCLGFKDKQLVLGGGVAVFFMKSKSNDIAALGRFISNNLR